MSLSRAELEAMDRDELLDTIATLSETVDDLRAEVDRQTKLREDLERETIPDLIRRLSVVEATVDDVEAENQRLRERIQTNNDKDHKIAQIVEYADNSRGDAPAVKLTATEIKGATGVSRRYAYDLMDDLPDEYDWFLRPAEMDQYGSLQIDNTDTRRLGIDFEGVHTTACPVNKFTTRMDGTGGED